jgi:hypothetical protein
VARDSLGASDLSEPQLRLAFQLNRLRVASAVVAQGVTRYPGARVLLSKIWLTAFHRFAENVDPASVQHANG